MDHGTKIAYRIHWWYDHRKYPIIHQFQADHSVNFDRCRDIVYFC